MSKQKLIRNIILVLAIFVLLIVLVVNIGDINKILNVLKGVNGLWILASCLAVVLYAFFYQLSFVILMKHRAKNVSIIDLYTISGSEFLFNSITPFSTGGQPFQAYALKRKNVSLSDSVSGLLINFIVYQICMNIISIIFMVLYYSKLEKQINEFIWFLVVGFSINMLIMVLLVLIGVCKPFGRLLVKMVVGLGKIKFLNKLLGNKKEALEEYVNNMQGAFREMIKSFKVMFFVILTKVISFLIYYSVPIFGLYAIGVELKGSDIPYVMALTAFSLVISIWVPTPGASGGVEYAFKTLYTPLIDTCNYTGDSLNAALSVMLIWRMLTYYFLIIYGFILYIIFEKKNSNLDDSSVSTEPDIN